MIWIANSLVALVALLHVYFLVLEMFLWTRPLGLKTFRNSLDKAKESAVLAANQGLYNGFLAAGLIWGLVHGVPAFAFQIKTFFLLCVIVAGIYGAATVSRRILLVQAAPAAVALILLWRRKFVSDARLLNRKALFPVRQNAETFVLRHLFGRPGIRLNSRLTRP
jgi:putative membrane protein